MIAGPSDKRRLSDLGGVWGCAPSGSLIATDRLAGLLLVFARSPTRDDVFQMLGHRRDGHSQPFTVTFLDDAALSILA